MFTVVAAMELWGLACAIVEPMLVFADRRIAFCVKVACLSCCCCLMCCCVGLTAGVLRVPWWLAGLSMATGVCVVCSAVAGCCEYRLTGAAGVMF